MDLILMFSDDNVVVPHVFKDVTDSEFVAKFGLDPVRFYGGNEKEASYVVDIIKDYYGKDRDVKHFILLKKDNILYYHYTAYSNNGIHYGDSSNKLTTINYDSMFHLYIHTTGLHPQHYMAGTTYFFNPNDISLIKCPSINDKSGNYSVQLYAKKDDTLPIKLKSRKIESHGNSHIAIKDALDKEKPFLKYEKTTVAGYGNDRHIWGFSAYRDGDTYRIEHQPLYKHGIK